jgi:glycosyltransferase involved in cell wall biosynthesis
MLEAMEMGKPVIGTRFGGNLEFMNDDVSLLVNYKLVPLEKDALPYRKGWLWAEPDIEMAAGFMRQLYENREFGNQLGAKAKSFIASHYSVSSFEQAFEEWAKETPIKSYVGQTRQRNFR